MKYGGQTQYGSGAYGGDPYGFSPGYVTRRMVASLERFRFDGTTFAGESTKCVHTLARLTGNLEDQKTWDLLTTAGLPAMFVVYTGGTFVPQTANNVQWKQTVNFSVVALAAQQRDRVDRMEGRNIYHCGTETMIRWALRFVLREMIQISMITNPQPSAERQLVFGAERFAAVLDFQASAIHCIPDDVSTVTLDKLGIVHTPNDLNDLFLPDNITPNSDDPTAVATAVATLADT